MTTARERRSFFRTLLNFLRARGGTLIFLALAASFGSVVLRSPALVTAHLNKHQIGHSASLVLRSWSDVFLSPWFWGLVVVILVLERLFPARPGEGMFSVGAAQDLVWFVFFAGFQLTVVHLYYVLLGGVDDHVLGNIGLRPSVVLGSVGVAVFAFVVTDLLNWLSHYTRHRVPAFWRFHEIHHSQRSLSMFTDARVHFVEPIIASTIVFVPAALLGLPAETAAVVATATLFYQRFFHANIRTNLGPLRYILVTPQSHRMHHSKHREDFDTNFATVFSIWDRLFRTQHPSHDTYPETGLESSAVPVETSARPLALLTTYARQIVYPFRALYSRPRVSPSRADQREDEAGAMQQAQVA